MTLHEIENLSFAELKAQRTDLVESLKETDAGALAARYVQARMDAKQRDEKLAEQGKTIALLQASLEKAAGEQQALLQQLKQQKAYADAGVKASDQQREEIARLKSESAEIIAGLTAIGVWGVPNTPPAPPAA